MLLIKNKECSSWLCNAILLTDKKIQSKSFDPDIPEPNIFTMIL